MAEGLARDPATAARRAARDDDPADHRDSAGLPRAVPLHVGRAGELDADRAAADLQLRVRQLARRRLRQGDGLEPHAGRLPRAVLAHLPARDALLESGMSDESRPAALISPPEWNRA